MISYKEKFIAYYDSSGNFSNKRDVYLNAMLEWLRGEHADEGFVQPYPNE
jgi:hypothetical protein